MTFSHNIIAQGKYLQNIQLLSIRLEIVKISRTIYPHYVICRSSSQDQAVLFHPITVTVCRNQYFLQQVSFIFHLGAIW